MTVARQMLDAYPAYPAYPRGGIDRHELAARIEACYECAQACTACADACLSEEMVDQLRMCRTDLVHACRCGEGGTGTVATTRARDRQPNGYRRTGGRLVGQLSAVPQGSATGRRVTGVVNCDESGAAERSRAPTDGTS